MNRLKDKTAVITGGAGGIGMATAKLFLEEGAKVMLVDLREGDLKEAVKTLDSPNAFYCAADVSRLVDVKTYTNEAISKLDKVDIFFNNAGIEGNFFPIEEYPEDIFDKVIAVNLKGVWLGCQVMIPKMANGGSVIITSSVAGLKGFKGLGAYVASKHATIGIMRTAALEFADKKIRVNTIHPGPVDNRMMRAIEQDISPEDPKEAKQGFENVIPFGRYAESEEIGKLVLFLASDDSKYITGTTNIIDGGMMNV